MSLQSDISRALVEKTSSELKESEGIAKVCDDPHGDSDCSSALGVDTAAKVVSAEPLLRTDKTSRQFVSRDFQGEFAVARVAETAGAKGNAVLTGSALYQLMIDESALRIVKIHRYRPASASRVNGSVDADELIPVAMFDPMQFVNEPARKASNPCMDVSDANLLYIPQPVIHCGQGQIIKRSVFKGFRPLLQVIAACLN